MKSNIEIVAQRTLLLIKLDAQSLFNRIKTRKLEYMLTFAVKRTRVHFDKVFFNRYRDVGIHDLLHCPEECILSIDAFYNLAEKIEWYFSCTEDMPNTVEDKLDRWIRELDTALTTMNLYVDAELGYADDSEAEVSTFESTDFDEAELPAFEGTEDIVDVENLPFE